MSGEAPRNATESGHPDHATYSALYGMAEKMHQQSSIAASPEMNRQAALALLTAYKNEGLRADASLKPDAPVDGIVLSQSNARHPDVGGRYAILYQGEPGNPTSRTLGVPTSELIRPADQSLQQLDGIDRQLQQTRGQQPPGPTQAAPVQGQGMDAPTIGARSQL